MIKHDSGDAPVSRRAAVNALDADGRRYTVLFQSRLPALTLGWAAAPAGAANLSLHVQSAAGEKTIPSPAEPNNAFGPEACLAIPLNKTAWQDWECTAVHYFTCERY